MTPLYALIMAGGRGSRFWPLSRRHRPKQCIDLVGGASLLTHTLNRLAPIIPPERTLVVTGPDMEEAVREQLGSLPTENILVEPEGRNTAPAIGWGAVEVQRRTGGESVLAVLPADHQIGIHERLRAVLLASAQAARATNALITIGVRPTRADTGYGYLEVGASMGEWGGFDFKMVERFIEKPDLSTAEEYLAEGRFLWNAGMFVFTVDAVRDAFRTWLPRTALALEKLQRNPERLHELWPQLDATSIDYGIMEKSRHIMTVPCDMEWSDLGTWNSVDHLLPVIEGGRGQARDVIAIDAQGCVVHAPEKVVALIGVQDLVVVDTGDVLLVIDRARAQDVRALLDRMKAMGLDHLT